MAVIPYMPSLKLYRIWMKHRLAGAGDEEAWEQTLHQSGIKPRDLARTYIAGAHGQERLLLSAAIEGGASEVKRGHSEKWHLSDHGRWPVLHLRAMETAYSSTPYYIHYMDGISRILEDIKAGDGFAAITSALHSVAKEALNVEELLPKIKNDIQNLKKFDKSEIEDTESAIFDVIFRNGPDAIFALL